MDIIRASETGSMFSIPSTLKARAERSTETTVNFYRTTQCHIPEEIALLCEKLKSQRVIGEDENDAEAVVVEEDVECVHLQDVTLFPLIDPSA